MAAKTRDRKPVTLENDLLATLSIGRGRSRRRLSDEEREVLVGMFAHKVGTKAFDIRTLAPAGSFSARLLRHFDDTDISYAVPLFTLVSTAASWLTQNGAHLEVPGVGEIVPTMWTVLLAESGEAKTLASDEVMKCLSLDGESPVSLLPDPGSDAQWIDDVATDPTAFWLQDEAGKFLRKVLTDTRFHRIKPWMLDAYSGKPISNRLKGEKDKLVVERPSFDFLGLSVTSTWKLDIDITSMLDGYCQRMNYVLAPARTDTDMYEHFLYFNGPCVDARRAELNELWHALCNQQGAAGRYTLNDHVVPLLEKWWHGLRKTVGTTPLPGSFIRRIGFATLKYLPVLHFLLGKSRHKIDPETAELATRFAELHLQSALSVLQNYSASGAGGVQKISELRTRLHAEGKPASARNIGRRLSKLQRETLDTETITQIVSVLDGIEEVPGLIASNMTPKAKSLAMQDWLDEQRARLAHNERKRNERRLRELRREFRKSSAGTSPAASASPAGVVPFTSPAPTSSAETAATRNWKRPA